MMRIIVRMALAGLVLAPVQGVAEPINLDFSYFSSDRTTLYQSAVKPFVDAVTNAADGTVHIKTHFSGALGPAIKQAELVREGTVDIAAVLPGYTPDLFPDTAIIEMPGLYRNNAEATAAYTRLLADNAMRGYEPYFVIAAFAAPAETIHTRSGATSLADLRGKRIRANNDVAKAVLEKLGMVGVRMPVNQTADALAAGKIDGVAIPPGALFDFGMSRFVTHHYLLEIGSAPIAVVMNRKKFLELPANIQDVIRHYSGQWLNEQILPHYALENELQIRNMKENPRRKVIVPSRNDLATAQRGFREVVSEWLASDPRNQSLYAVAHQEIAKQRSKGPTAGNPR